MLPFGKYQGQSIHDIYIKDQSYIDWLLDQPWFQVRYQELYRIVSQELIKEKKEIIIDENTTIIYTDGACKNNGCKGEKRKRIRAGIGIHFSEKNKIRLEDISTRIYDQHITNNIAELKAIKKAIEVCIENKIDNLIVIYTDSDYSLKCLTTWYDQWEKQNLLEGKKNK